jgi:hypothetical protein
METFHRSMQPPRKSWLLVPHSRSGVFFFIQQFSTLLNLRWLLVILAGQIWLYVTGCG